MKLPQAKNIFLILFHLIILNGIFTFRFPMEEAFQYRNQFETGAFTRGPLDHIRLYYSANIDEAYYYEWSRLVLGKPFEADYPIEKRIISPIRERLKEPSRLRLPYRDISFEYPPLLAVPILTAGLFSPNYMIYTRAFALLVSLAYMGCLWVAYYLWKRIPRDQKFSWPLILSFSALAILALGQLYVTRLDVFPNFLFLLALYFFLREKYYFSSMWLAFGTLTKAYPFLLAPLFAMILLSQKKYRILLVSIAYFLVWFLGVNLSLEILTEGKYWQAFTFHSSRGIQIESFYALISYASNLLLETPIQIYNSHNSINIGAPHTKWLLHSSLVLPFLLFLGIYGLSWKILRKNNLSNNPNLILYPALLLIFAFIISFKVLSPQFLIWLVPLIFLISPKKRILFPIVFLIILLISQLIFPSFYHLLESAHPIGVLMLFLRNGGLLFLFVGLIFQWGTAERIAMDRNLDRVQSSAT